MNPAWRDDAICSGDPELWFSDPRTREAARARTLCGTCPSRYDCLDYAIRSRPVLGIWAGLDHNQLTAAYGHIRVCHNCDVPFASGRANAPGYCCEACRKAKRREQQTQWSHTRRTTPHRKVAA